LVSSLAELWADRELIRTLAERDLRVRYKQAVLGFVWAVLSPFVLMVVFSLFFQRVAKIDTHGAPYPLFAYLGLIPWSFFSSSMSSGGTSILSNTSLLNKVYCPREVFPIASMGVTAVDTVASLVMLALLFVIYQVVPSPLAIVWMPAILFVLVAFTLGTTLLVSAVVVYFRDLRQAIPLLLQLGLFATPVAYGIEFIPQRWRTIYAALNPLAEVIDGLRATLLYHHAPNGSLLAVWGLSASIALFLGYLVLKRLETRFADVA
jgi:ABC-2 type transport system permease protein/lipopolysaccharide transport system permease protein